MPDRYPVLDHPGPIAFAHRGGAAEAPENSPRAFRHAVDLGYRYLETDLRATRDGVCIAFHDATLSRTTDREGTVRDLPWADVRQARIHGTEPIPLFEELLEEYPDVRFNIDVKEAHSVGPFLQVLRRTGTVDRVLTTSFGGIRLDAVRREVGPRLATALTPAEVARLFTASRRRDRTRTRTSTREAGLRFRRPPGAAAAQVPERVGPRRLVDRRFVHAAHRAGLQVHVWTVNDPAAMTRLLDLGVDGLMTDRPTQLREVLRERGQWVP
ncbi:MAG: glycerophosphodiester phosphodiesterase [Candidatus Nanopelagicales bacterium]